MTKINKLGKSSFAIAILSFILVAVLTFGGTYAYFSDRADAVNGDITTGHLNITLVKGTGESNKLKAEGTIAQPNEVIFRNETVTTTVKSNIAYFTRVRFRVTIDTPTHEHHDNESTEHPNCNDIVANNADILKIIFKDGGVSGSTGTKWQTKDTDADAEGGALKDGEDMIYYQLAPTIADHATNDKYNDEDGEGTETFTFTIQVKDWVGNNGDKGTKVDETTGETVPVDNRAEGCDYWMDVKITVQVIVEVLQADFLLNDGDPDNDRAKPFANGAEADEKWNQAMDIPQTKDDQDAQG